MTAIEDALAALARLERAQRPADASALRALIAEHERLTAPPTDEWEYAVRDAEGRIWFKATAGARPGDIAIRRRKVGQWEPVEAVRDA
jgi:hypothetical protein